MKTCPTSTECDAPLRLPGGTKVVARFVYDNSIKNSANPNSPPKTVLFGEQSTDEMASIFFRVTADTAGQLGVFVRHNQEYYDSRRTNTSSATCGRSTRNGRPRAGNVATA